MDWRHVEPISLTPILQTARDAFYTNGFHGTSMRNIAKPLGITVPALYYHHENKEALLIALLELSTSDIGARVEAADLDGGDDPVVRLSNVSQAVIIAMTHRARLSALDSESRYLGEANRDRYHAARDRTEVVMRAIVEDGAKKGVFRVSDPRETTRAILGMIQSIPRWFDAQGQDSPEVVAERYVEIILRVVGYQG